MKKVAYISATILEILCLAGAWAVQFFTRTKMGMARYVVYKNRGWESRYPMELLAKGAALPDRHASSLFPAPEKEPDKSAVGYERRYGASDIWICGIYMDEFNK